MAGGMDPTQQAPAFRHALLAWFEEHKRDLPWRRTRDPYAIWVSEIMLQQTRVAAVLEHYARWMERFPRVEALAAAGEPEVLALWSGLGYYRRARFLHAGAKAVMRDHGGALPGTAEALRKLPGVGEYTAAAIASIAFGEAMAVVDGNVERVVMRLAGLGVQTAGGSQAGEPGTLEPGTLEPGTLEPGTVEPGTVEPRPPDSVDAGAQSGVDALAAGPSRRFRVLAAAPLAREIRVIAHALLAPERAGDANQAMMELGATVCLPRAPLCLHCPVVAWCATRGEHLSTPRKAMRSRTIAYALALRAGQGGGKEILLVRRSAESSLMPGMWELPEAEVGAGTPLLTVRHAITVTNYTVHIVAGAGQAAAGEQTRWTPLDQLPGVALTGLARKVIKRLQLWPAQVALKAELS